MKLVPIIMDYCLLHFDALKFFLVVPKFPGHCPIFTEVIDKKNFKHSDKFTPRELRKFLKRDHHEADIFSTTT